MVRKLCIYIDESGTLSKNPKNPPYYVYAGYWCTSSHCTAIESSFAKHLNSFFPSTKQGEKKASSIKNRKKRYLLKGIMERNGDSFHPIFIVEGIKGLEKPLDSKENVQYHKNYLLRRFVETCVQQYRRIYNTKVSEVIVNIDDQSRTELMASDSFPTYLNKYFAGRYMTQNYTESDAIFNVNFRDSNKYRSIQICDILANCKYNHYIHGRDDLFFAISESSAQYLKLP